MDLHKAVVVINGASTLGITACGIKTFRPMTLGLETFGITMFSN